MDGRGPTGSLVGLLVRPYDRRGCTPGACARAMSKKKDCFGSETYVCRTSDCPYMAECVQVVWDKKLRRVVAQRSGLVSDARLRPAPSIRVRSKEFMQGGS